MNGISSVWINHVFMPFPYLTVSAGPEVTIPCDWTMRPLEAGTPVSLWLRADVPDHIDGNHYRIQWSADQDNGTHDVSAAQLAAGLRIDWLAQSQLDAPILSVRTLNDAPAMVVRELALMRSYEMTSAFTVAPFEDWYVV